MLPGNLRPHPAAPSLKVFISYSRRDMEFAERLVAALEARGQEVIIDRRDLPLLEQWQVELQGFIRNADAVVFILSPASIGSKWCEWEVQEVTSLSKRLAPVVAVPIPPDLRPPDAVERLNYVFFTPPHEFEEQADKLVKALNTNFDWVKEHTRLGELARRWHERGRPGRLLLQGSEIGEAERWAVTRPRESPATTDLHVTFIQASRRWGTRKQRTWIAGSTVVAATALALAGFAYWERAVAVKNEVRAITGEQLARDNERRAEQQRDQALTTQSRFLAGLAQQASAAGEPVEGELLALAGLPDVQSQFARPRVPEAERAAYEGNHAQREIATLRGHQSIVIAAVFSLGHRRIATAARDKTARLWDVDAGATLAVLRGHTMALTSVAFSRDGRHVVTTSEDTTARLWDAESGEALAVLKGHESAVSSATFSPDGSLVITASKDNTARLWEAASGREIMVFRGHEHVIEKIISNETMFMPDDKEITLRGVNSASFSADGRRLVTAGIDRTARVWDAKSGAALVVLKGHQSEVIVAAFSPDGKHILTASGDATARLWDAETGAELATMEGHKGRLSTASFSADGSLIATTCEDNAVRLWNGTTGASVAVLNGQNKIVMAAISPDGDLVVSASQDHTARLWDVKTTAEIAVLKGHSGSVHSAAFSADGRRLVTASADGTARLWDAKWGNALRGHKGTVHTVSISDDGARILTASSDRTARLWDVQSGTVLRVFKGHGDTVRSAAFGPGGRLVVTASHDNTARLWDSSTGEFNLIISGHEDGRQHDPGKIALTLAEQDPDYTIKYTYERGVTGAAFSPDGLRIVTTSFDRTARIWDVNTGAPLAVLRGHDETVYSGGFSPDGLRIITASQDGTARLWNAQTGQEIAVLKGHKGAVRRATFSPDGSRVVTVSVDRTARLWDAESGDRLAVFSHNQAVYSAAFSPNGRRLVTASGDGLAWLWDVETTAVIGFLRGHTGGVTGADFSPDGSRVITASDDNTVRVWRAFQDTQGLVEHIKRAAPRCLTPAEREKAFLEPEPPRWCITGPGLEQEADATKWVPKWPYDKLEWRDWLVAADAARRRALVAPPIPK
jgi:WD40 repeat protein